MTIVIKRSGAEEDFDPLKLKCSIDNACIDIGYSESKMKELNDKIALPLIEEVNKMDKVKSIELREKILMKLEELAPDVAKAWREHGAAGYF